MAFVITVACHLQNQPVTRVWAYAVKGTRSCISRGGSRGYAHVVGSGHQNRAVNGVQSAFGTQGDGTNEQSVIITLQAQSILIDS
jgi:hypothetical protein